MHVPLETGAGTTALVYRAAESGPPDADGRTLPAAQALRSATGPPVATLMLGHGAGAGQRSAFMVSAGRAISALGIDVVTFNFPYAEQGRRIPDRAPVLEACYRTVIETARRDLESARRPLFIGGKSMGGRIATQVAAADAALPIAGLVLLGYPLHPPGRPDQRRDKHLPAIQHPMLFVQGSRDAFGTPAELAPIVAALAPGAERSMLHVVDGGDHSFKVARADASRQAAVADRVHRTVAEWISSITEPLRVNP
jgi:predicted alpha/beta-hydrolase family hydrolase